MVTRLDKCVTFGIKKFSSRSLQFLPKLLINSEVVPPVKTDESFRYLGHFFNFNMEKKNESPVFLDFAIDLHVLYELMRMLIICYHLSSVHGPRL